MPLISDSWSVSPLHELEGFYCVSNGSIESILGRSFLIKQYLRKRNFTAWTIVKKALYTLIIITEYLAKPWRKLPPLESNLDNIGRESYMWLFWRMEHNHSPNSQFWSTSFPKGSFWNWDYRCLTSNLVHHEIMGFVTWVLSILKDVDT